MNKVELKKKIEEVLRVPVYDDGGSITYPSVTVAMTQNAPGILGDGKSLSRVFGVKVDLWYLTEEGRDQAESLIYDMLEKMDGVTTPDIISVFDTQARKYRATFDFEMI